MTHSTSPAPVASDAAPFLPMVATIAGVEVVTIPVAEYADLLDCRRRVAELREQGKRYAVPSRSPIETDAEVAAFFTERFGHVEMMSIIFQAQKRFGLERTPSRTAAYAYWQRLRRRAGSVEGKAK